MAWLFAITKYFAPPSHGVSSGPKITAFHFKTLSGLGEAFTPGGGSAVNFLKSRINRFRAGVDIWLPAAWNFLGTLLLQSLHGRT